MSQIMIIISIFFNKTISKCPLLLFILLFSIFLWVLINFHLINILCKNIHQYFSIYFDISIKSNYRYIYKNKYFHIWFQQLSMFLIILLIMVKTIVQTQGWVFSNKGSLTQECLITRSSTQFKKSDD